MSTTAQSGELNAPTLNNPLKYNNTSHLSSLKRPSELNLAHGRILYLEDVSVSFDGFKAINNLSLDIAPGELR